ncbi:MAG TPA: cytochrome c3 family protein [Gemmatimonadaceae bacterium]|nr:cytochrome c3 family protein [Gemmatimonadaceae bacterium]
MIPGLVALAAAAVLMSAYQGASTSAKQTPAVPPGHPQFPQQPAHQHWAYWGGSTEINRAPVQPINFPHPLHVKTLGMNCVYCHFSAFKSIDPGMPAMSTCMGCHRIVGPNRPATASGPARKSAGIAKLTAYWNAKKPVPWIRVHKVPDYVNFPHFRHVNAGIQCQYCHGPVQNMSRVYQYAPLSMGWCVNCHVQHKVRYDCSVCHY